MNDTDGGGSAQVRSSASEPGAEATGTSQAPVGQQRRGLIEEGHFSGVYAGDLSASDLWELLESRKYVHRLEARYELERRNLIWRRRWRNE